jgi:hypothetical protein
MSTEALELSLEVSSAMKVEAALVGAGVWINSVNIGCIVRVEENECGGH